jgi:DNA-binding GntR family transcriptional regulator
LFHIGFAIQAAIDCIHFAAIVAQPMTIDAYVEQSAERSQTRADAIADALRKAVLEGVLKDGTVLRQADLAAKFRVSRIPIREALLKLQADGLVEAQPRRGTVVTSLDADDFAEILEMRAALEPLALKLALPRMKVEDLAAAARILADAEQHITGPGRADASGRTEFETRWGDLNWAFHRALYAPAARRRLLDTIENLHLLFARHLRLRIEIIAPALLPSASSAATPRDTAEWAGVMREHRDILEACERRDARLACSVLTRHISGHGAELVRRLRTAQASSVKSV